MSAFFIFNIMEVKDLHPLGKITKLHGYKGEFTIWINSSSPFDYVDLETLFLFQKGRVTPFIIEDLGRKTNTTLRMKLEGINSEAEALPWVKAEIFIRPEEVSETDQMRDNIRGWIGFRVFTDDNQPIGVLAEVNDSGVNPLMEIDRDGQTIYVPLQPAFIAEIKEEDHHIFLSLPPGLLELYEK